MKPSKQAIEARINIVNYLGDQMSSPFLRFQEDEIELIIQAAIDEAIEKHVDDVAAEWEQRYIELEARLMRSQHNHAEAVKELNEWRIKAESLPAQDEPHERDGSYSSGHKWTGTSESGAMRPDNDNLPAS